MSGVAIECEIWSSWQPRAPGKRISSTSRGQLGQLLDPGEFVGNVGLAPDQPETIPYRTHLPTYPFP